MLRSVDGVKVIKKQKSTDQTNSADETLDSFIAGQTNEIKAPKQRKKPKELSDGKKINNIITSKKYKKDEKDEKSEIAESLNEAISDPENKGLSSWFGSIYNAEKIQKRKERWSRGVEKRSLNKKLRQEKKIAGLRSLDNVKSENVLFQSSENEKYLSADKQRKLAAKARLKVEHIAARQKRKDEKRKNLEKKRQLSLEMKLNAQKNYQKIKEERSMLLAQKAGELKKKQAADELKRRQDQETQKKHIAENQIRLKEEKRLRAEALKQKKEERQKQRERQKIRRREKRQKIVFYLKNNFKKIVASLFLLLIILILILVALGYVVYYSKDAGALRRILISKLPFPAILVDWKPIYYSSYLDDFRLLSKYYQATDENAGEFLAKDLIVDAMIEKRLLDTLADKYDITVSDQDLIDKYNYYESAYEVPEDYTDVIYNDYGLTKELFLEKVIYYHVLKDKINVSFIQDDDIHKSVALRLKKVLKLLSRGNVEFEEMAEKYSEDEQAQRGGDIGFVKFNNMSGQLQAVAADLDINEVSDIIREEGAYYVVKLYDKKTQRAGVEYWLKKISMYTNYNLDQYLTEMKTNAKVLILIQN
ncbi:MAG: peptidylprolyl isomerase [bacterium]|nr:peptidylprolyl isomerase [bacterium]